MLLSNLVLFIYSFDGKKKNLKITSYQPIYTDDHQFYMLQQENEKTTTALLVILALTHFLMNILTVILQVFVIFDVLKDSTIASIYLRIVINSFMDILVALIGREGKLR